MHDNVFSLDPDNIGKTCASRSGCGYNGLFSNWGTFPTWSPYQKASVQDAITYHQGNRFFSNTYAGPWNFIVHGQGTPGELGRLAGRAVRAGPRQRDQGDRGSAERPMIGPPERAAGEQIALLRSVGYAAFGRHERDLDVLDLVFDSIVDAPECAKTSGGCGSPATASPWTSTCTDRPT